MVATYSRLVLQFIALVFGLLGINLLTRPHAAMMDHNLDIRSLDVYVGRNDMFHSQPWTHFLPGMVGALVL